MAGSRIGSAGQWGSEEDGDGNGDRSEEGREEDRVVVDAVMGEEFAQLTIKDGRSSMHYAMS